MQLIRRPNRSQRHRDRNGQRTICAACGHPGTPTDPITLDNDGFRVHRSHNKQGRPRRTARG